MGSNNIPNVVLVLVVVGAIVVGGSLTKEDMQKLLDNHNYLRANLSNNGHSGLGGNNQPTAADMLMMHWDDGLAKLAEIWAKACVFEHPKKSEHPEYKLLGQNLATASYKDIIPRSVLEWYNEVQWYNYGAKQCRAGYACGHYTQVSWAKTYKVGCGYANCKGRAGSDGLPYEHYIVCNYKPPGNYRGQFIYQKGRAGTKCPASHPFSHKGLCVKTCAGKSGCGCKLDCINGGQLKSGKCICKNCNSGFYGNRCQKKCVDKHKSCPFVTPAHCSIADAYYPYWPQNCPSKCGACVTPSRSHEKIHNKHNIRSRIPGKLILDTDGSGSGGSGGGQGDNGGGGSGGGGGGGGKIMLIMKPGGPKGSCDNMVLDKQCKKFKKMGYCSALKQYCKKTCGGC